MNCAPYGILLSSSMCCAFALPCAPHQGMARVQAEPSPTALHVFSMPTPLCFTGAIDSSELTKPAAAGTGAAIV